MKKNQKESAEKVRNTPRFHVLDAVIILVVIFAVVCVYFRNNIMDYLTGEKNMKEYVVSFTIEDVRENTLKYVNVDDIVRFAEDGEEWGVIMTHIDNSEIPFSKETAFQFFASEDGNSLVKVYYPNEERVSADGRILCNGRYSSAGGLMVNGDRYLSSGQYVTVQTEMVTLTILITGVEPLEQ